MPIRRSSRHRLQPVQLEESVALGVVGLSLQDRADQPRDQSRVHLPVAVQLDDDLRAVRQRRAVARHGGSAHTEVAVVSEHPHTRVGTLGLDVVAASLRTGVVHHVDGLALRPDPREHPQNLLLDPVAGNHDRNHATPILACAAVTKSRRLRAAAAPILRRLAFAPRAPAVSAPGPAAARASPSRARSGRQPPGGSR